MRVGDKIIIKPETFGEAETQKSKAAAPMEGTVSYIHKSGRWFTVSFDCKGQTIKESFMAGTPYSVKEGGKRKK